jgi:GxxExxY protein
MNNDLTYKIISCAMEVHRNLGPGLLESSYQKCLQHELELQGLTYEAEKPMPLVYKEIQLEQGYRIDLLVQNEVVVELKSVDAVLDVHEAQILTYMKLGHYSLGLLINFNVPLLRNGIKRFINS